MNQRCSNHFWQVAEFARIQPAHASVEFLRIQLLSILLALAAMPAAAEDWPVVRGDTLGTGVAKSAVPENPEVLWTYRAKQDAGFDATAVIVDGIIYVGDSAGTLSMPCLIFTCASAGAAASATAHASAALRIAFMICSSSRIL